MPKKINKRIAPWLFIAVIVSAIIGAGLVAYFSWLAIPITLAIIVLVTAIILVFDKPWLGVVLVAFFLPFERIGGIDVVGDTTLRVSQIFTVVTIASWLLYYLIIKKRAYKSPDIIWPLLVYLGVAAISLVNAVNLDRAITVYAFSFFVIVFALVISQVIRKTVQVQNVIWALLISAVLVSLFGIYQFVGDVVGLPVSLTGLREHYTQSVFGFPRVHSTALEPLYFANYLLIPIAIAFMLWLNKASLQKKAGENFLGRVLGSRWFLLGVVLLGVMALVLTLSRGGYLGLAATGILLLLLGWKRIFTPRNTIILVATFSVIVVIAMAFISFSGRFSLDTFLGQATEYQSGASIEERFSTYQEAEKIFTAYPLLGVGIGNFGPEVAIYSHRMPKSGWLIVNNEPLEILAETGIMGLAAIVGMIIILLWQGFRAWWRAKDIVYEGPRLYLRAILGGSLAAFIGIIVQYQTFSTLYILHVWFLVGLIAAVTIIINRKLTALNYEK